MKINKTSTIHNGREIINGSDALWYRFKMIDDVYFRMAYASISQIFVLESVCSVSTRATVSTLWGQWNGDGINRALVKTWLTALSRPTEVTSVLAAFSLSPHFFRFTLYPLASCSLYWQLLIAVFFLAFTIKSRVQVPATPFHANLTVNSTFSLYVVYLTSLFSVI